MLHIRYLSYFLFKIKIAVIIDTQGLKGVTYLLPIRYLSYLSKNKSQPYAL